jgi:hypothetical protein
MNKMTKKCAACGSEKVVPNIMIEGQVGKFYYEENPAALVRKKRKWGTYAGTVCGDCGVITLRADDPAKMWEEYQQLSK